MPDEQVQSHDPAHDAIDQFQDELERRIEELRALAASDTASAGATAAEPPTPRAAGSYQPQDPEFQPASRQRSDWEDAVMRPVQTGAGGYGQGNPQPDVERTATAAPPQRQAAATQRPGGFVPDPGQSGSASSSPTSGAAPARGAAASHRASLGGEPTPEETEFWAHTRTALRVLQQSQDELRHELPDEIGRLREEVTRELTTRLSQQVTSVVAGQVERIVRDELSAPSLSLRQLQQQLPSISDRIAQLVSEELEAPAESMRQMQDEMPLQLERVERSVERAVRDDMEAVERTLTASIERMERSLRSQVEHVETDMRNELERIAQAVRDELEAPSGAIRQLQEEVPAQMQRLERIVREVDANDAVNQLGTSLSEQKRTLDAHGRTIAESAESLRRQRDEQRTAQRDSQSAMRDEFATIRTSLREMIDQHVGSTLIDVVTANKLTLERLSGLSGELENDRVQRVEDLEMLVDTMTTGYQGLFNAVNKVLDRFNGMEQRLDEVGESLAVLPNIEQRVDSSLGHVRSELTQHLEDMQSHLQGLAPAPVVVTVNHPDAQISQSTRGGYSRTDDDK